MKKNEAFTMIEVLVSIVITGILTLTIAGMLLYGFKAFNNFYEIKKETRSLSAFRANIFENFKRVRGGTIQYDNPVHPDSPYTEGGLVEYVTYRFPTWTAGGKSSVWKRSANPRYKINGSTEFLTYDRTRKEYKTVKYSLPQVLQNRVMYDEWKATTSGGDFTRGDRIMRQHNILLNLESFQTTYSANGLEDWELYSDPDFAAGSVVSTCFMRYYIRKDSTSKIAYWNIGSIGARSLRKLFYFREAIQTQTASATSSSGVKAL